MLRPHRRRVVGEVAFRFPVLGFTTDLENWGFPDLDRLTRCGPLTLEQNSQVGMELIDADGRRWTIRSFRRIGRPDPLLKWAFKRLLSGLEWRIEHEVDPLESVTLEDVQERLCASIAKFWMDYCVDGQREVEIPALQAQVRATRSVAEIYEQFQPDTFQSH